MDSNSFAINAGAATHLLFTMVPTNGSLAANPGDISVEVVDKNNNIVLTDSSTITLNYGVAPHGIAPLSVSLAATNGVATFSGVAFPLAGKYSLDATDGLLASANTGMFTLI